MGDKLFKRYSRSIRGSLFFILVLTVAVLLATDMAFINFVNRLDVMYNNITDSVIQLSDVAESIGNAKTEFISSNSSDNKNWCENLSNQFFEIKEKAMLARSLSQNEEQYYYIAFLENMLDSFSQKLEHFRFEEISEADVRNLSTDLDNISDFSDTINLLQLSELNNQRKAIKNQMHIYVIVMWLLTLFTAVILYILGHISIKRITKPIDRLVDYSAEIAKENFNIPDEDFEIYDELRVLRVSLTEIATNMDAMLDDIEEKNRIETELKDEKIDKLKMQNLYKETSLKLLYSQINPHFLFNTLNTIERMAYFGGNKDIEETISKLAGMLRYSLKNNDNPVPIIKELQNTRDYIEIQQKRFGSVLNYKENVETDCLDCIMPCFILQPLVENAIAHGLEPYDYNGTISINVYSHEEQVVIEILDDGVGMDVQEAVIERKESDSRDDLDKEFSHGIGLNNVMQRINSFNGNTNGFTISSCIGEGTLITIRLEKRYE